MDYLFNSCDNSTPTPRQERRKRARKVCAIEGNFKAQGRWHKGFILNISQGGAYIRTFQCGKFSPEEDIFLVARITFLREQLRGKIVWVAPYGIGVEFHGTYPM
jgi:Tfp pilus assembly protein PilZ